MTEEITYAELEFNTSYALENMPRPATSEEKGHRTTSPTWRLAALTFLTLCLVLLLGLLFFGIVFFQVSRDFKEEIGNLMKNQETLQTNFSKRLQDMKDNLCLEGEEEKNKNNGPICTLCPTNWKWTGGDTCFYVSTKKKSWADSQKFCSLQNSTLLMIKDRDKLGHLPPRDMRQYFWIGLHKSSNNSWYWEDGSALLRKKADWIDVYEYYTCGHLYELNIRTYDHCHSEYFWICEKAALKLRFHVRA
ncbi:C-type lectin domain family 12 member B-like isoform X2 [Carettochelys insculpta]|uniref:C-type lectin domain family 12 member B-like isoform X2 n=1 Tax=Carettochelys insculpta TaxID=44489 RepID=UPI003EB6B282